MPKFVLRRGLTIMRLASGLTIVLSSASLACSVGDAEEKLEQSARDFFFREAIRRGRAESSVAPATPVCLAAMRENVIRGGSPASYPDPPASVLGTLMRSDTPVVPGSACTLEDAPSGPPNWGMLVRHRSTGAPAILIWVGPVFTIGTDQATARLGYQEHGLSAAQWRCGAVRSNAQWRITNCDPEWQS